MAPPRTPTREPIKDAAVTSKFNPKRMHPVLKKIMPHNGTDFGAAVGTLVAGRVGVAGAGGGEEGDARDPRRGCPHLAGGLAHCDSLVSRTASSPYP